MSQLAPDSTSTATPIQSKELSKEDMFEFIADESEVQDKPAKEPVDKPLPKKEEDEEEEEPEETEEEEEEIDELAEIEAELEELDEPSKDKLEVVTPVSRREILKLYPDLFKKIPYLEKAYYREQQFTRVFQNPSDAKEAFDQAQTLQRFEEDIVGNGNQKNILKLIKDHNPDGFAKLADDYLDNLADIDEKAYHHVIGTISKQTIKSMWDEGKAANNTELMAAAVELNKFLFGSTVYKPPTKLAPADSPKKVEADKVSEREKSLVKQAYEGANSDVSSRVNRYLQLNVEKNIDPRQTMTDYVRKNATRDAIDKINDLMERDSRFKDLVDKAWVASAKENFSKSSIDKIIRAYISRGKSLLAPVVKSARNEALKGMGRRAKEDPIEDTDKGEEPKKRETSERRQSSSKKADLPKGMSTLDALNSLMKD